MRIFALILFTVIYFGTYSQNLKLSIHGIDDFRINYASVVSDSAEGIAEGQKVLKQLYEASYLGATVDSIWMNESTLNFNLAVGEQYNWINLSKGNLDEELVSKIDINSRLFLNRPFNSKQLSNLFRRSIQYFENNGYPFATIKLDSIILSENHEISASLVVTKNQYYKIDSILIKGNSGINRRFVLNYLGLEVGSPYNEEKIFNISTRLREIPFIAESKEFEVQYFEEGVKIILHLERKKSQSF